MTTKEYLRQAPRLDMIIDLKLAQVERLKSLRERVTASFSDTPKGGGSGDRVAEVTMKIYSMLEDINRDIDAYVDLKADIRKLVSTVQDDRYRMVLEYRYLCCYGWDKIAEIMMYEQRQIFRLHGRALQEINHVSECQYGVVI